MKKIWGLTVVATLIFLMSGCGDDDDGPTAVTNNPPDAVTDLSAIAVDDSAVTLSWNTPDDKLKMASVSAYDLRYSTSTITEANFESADTVHGEPSPGETGSADTLMVEGLDFGTGYYFAMKSVDDKGKWSALSNVLSASTDTVDNRLIAYYPLVDDSLDVTGKQLPIHLVNTPFQGGGIYCNGLYVYDVMPGGSMAQTDSLAGFDFQNFTISTRFKVDEYHESGWNYVLVGGDNARWIGIRLHPDSTMTFFHSGGAEDTDVNFVPGTWHEGRVTYDGTTGRCYIDGTLAAEAQFAIVHDDDPEVGYTHFGSGGTFKGTWGRLKVYSEVVAP